MASTRTSSKTIVLEVIGSTLCVDTVRGEPKTWFTSVFTVVTPPIPSLTRIADPNRVRGARLYTGTLCLFFFSQS